MNIRNAFNGKHAILVLIDLVMMLLLFANLTLIVFDWLFAVSVINYAFSEYLPVFHAYYDANIHQNFSLIDLAFVSVFLGEFALSWVLAIINRAYHRWYYYPFLHWYDLLGCIPVGSMRFLRILRFISITVRLQKLQVIDFFDSYLGKKIGKYYSIIVEEVSDRVVVNILEGVQDELTHGGPVVDRIIKDVIRPRQQLIVEWISKRLAYVADRDLVQKKEEINNYVKELVKEGIKSNPEVKALERVPVMGKMAKEAIERTISSTILAMMNQVMNDLASYRNRLLINDSADLILNAIEFRDDDTALNKMFIEIPVEVLEIVKDQVKVKKWKIKAEAEKESSELEQAGIEFLMTDEVAEKQ